MPAAGISPPIPLGDDERMASPDSMASTVFHPPDFDMDLLPGNTRTLPEVIPVSDTPEDLYIYIYIYGKRQPRDRASADALSRV